MWADLSELAVDHEGVLWWTLVASGVVFVGSLFVLPFLVARLPADYFAYDVAPPTLLDRQHPWLRLVLIVAKNVLGAGLLVAGLAMMVLPGQGLLTCMAALVLLDFPGKRRLERGLVRRSRVRASLNWIRRRAGVPPFLPPRDRT